jgi:hypothetical protein
MSVSEFGYYEGDIVAKWEDDGRFMTLIDTVKYIDPSGVEWIALAGSKTDGASIPQIAWTLVGGPYEGKHRKAAVFHDVACVEKTRVWEQVHRMFYGAMQAAGVSELTAKQMFAAVYAFGPKWEINPSAPQPPILFPEVTRAGKGKGGSRPQFDEASRTAELPSGISVPPPLSEVNPSDRSEFEDLKQKIAVENLSLEEIESFVQAKS